MDLIASVPEFIYLLSSILTGPLLSKNLNLFKMNISNTHAQ